MRNEQVENKVRLTVGAENIGKRITNEEDDEVSYTRVGSLA